jgi:5-methylcytosine-specific restriction endonuclease McrA
MNKVCKICGFKALEEWFPKNSRVCPCCFQEKQENMNQKERWTKKASAAIYNHAKKYRMNTADFINKYGWDVKTVAGYLEHAYEGPCPYCHERFIDIRDITLDIINPSDPPYFTTNVRAVCQKDNASKSNRTPAYYGLHLQMVKKRQEYLKKQAEAARLI